MHCSLEAYCATLGPPSILAVPASATRCPLTAAQRERLLVAKGGTLWAKTVRQFCLNVDFHATFRDLLHVANMRNRTDGFTSPPKEGVLRILSPLKSEPANLSTKGQHAYP